MITLAKHIEFLLLDNDCVIVPDLGGFIAHYQPSYYDERDHSYHSPKRVIGFNPKLIMNDGLLVQSYMQTFQTDFSDANKRIEEEVEKIKDKLYNDGSIEIPKIGILSLNIDNEYKFIPSNDNITSPNLYGLSSFVFDKIEDKKRCAKIVNNKTKQTDFTLRNSNAYKWATGIVAVAVIFIMFFFLSVPVENSYIENDNYAYLGDAGLLNSIKSKSFATTIISNINPKAAQKVNIPTSKKTIANVKSEVKKNIKPQTNISNTQEVAESMPKKEEPKDNIIENSDKKYHIIIATLHTERGAQKALEQFQKRGLKDANIIKGRNIYRISLCDFDEQASAYNKMNELKSNGDINDAWIMCSK